MLIGHMTKLKENIEFTKKCNKSENWEEDRAVNGWD